jgi:uncharacterized membrane protein YcaP (DUF421 family)
MNGPLSACLVNDPSRLGCDAECGLVDGRHCSVQGGYSGGMWFQSWSDLGRVVVVAVLVYPLLVVMVRISGKRTLAKMNAFDLVVTVALGSTLATILLSRDVSLAEGGAALVMLILLQFAATWAAVRSRRIRELLKSEPSVLLCDGELRPEVMRAQRVTLGEICQAVRAQGIGDLRAVAAVVLETDGSFSVVPTEQAGRRNALPGMEGVGKPRTTPVDGRRPAKEVG